jgi:hypothetical protein
MYVEFNGFSLIRGECGGELETIKFKLTVILMNEVTL